MTNLRSKKKQLKVCILDMHHHKLTCKLWPFILCKAGVDTQQLVVYLFTSRFSALQYRSEISGQRVFSFVIHSHQWHSSPSSLNKRQDKSQVLQTPLKIFPPTNKFADTFLAMHMVLTNVRLLLEYFCYGPNVNENNTSHRFSVIIACAVAV